MATHYFDPVAGNNSNNGTTYALRKKDLGSLTLSAGDVARCIASPDPFRLQDLSGTDVTADWTNLDDDIDFNATVCKVITQCESAWTASANVTAAADANRKEGSFTAWFNVAAGFTTGKAAYFATGSLDLSDCTQVSLWIWVSFGTIPANALSIRLCSDTTGDTPVNTFTVPYAMAAVTGQWLRVVFDNAGALGASIQSISISFSSDPGNVFLLLDNITATSANGPTLLTLIGKSSDPENKNLWPIRSLSASGAKLDQGVTSQSTSAARGYSGATESVATYGRKIEQSFAVQTLGQSGTSGNRITVSGGWNRTDGSTQDGLTIIYNPTVVSNSILASGKTDFNFERLIVLDHVASQFHLQSCSRFTLTDCGGINGSGSGNILTGSGSATDMEFVRFMAIGHNSSSALNMSGTVTRGIFTDCEAYSNLIGFGAGATFTNPSGFTGCIANNNATAFQLPTVAFQMPFTNCTANNNTDAFNANSNSAGGSVDIYAPSFSGNTQIITTNAPGHQGIRVFDCTGSDATSASTSVITQARVRYHRHGGVQTDERERALEGWILKVDDSGWAGTGHTPSGSVWRLQPNSNASVNSPLVCLFEPGVLPVGSYTVTLKSYRTNVNVTGKLVVKGGRTDGIASDTASSTISAAINTSETLSVSFDVDTEGPVWLEFHSYFTSGSTGEVWFDEITIS